MVKLRLSGWLLAAMLLPWVAAPSSGGGAGPSRAEDLAVQLLERLSQKPEEEAAPGLTLEVGGRSYSVTLEDSRSARALLGRLPLRVTMSELNGNEKFYNLEESLPTDPVSPGHIQAGDLMLYGDNCLVLFYDSFPTSYRYTRLGRVDDLDGLAAALGRGDVEVVLQAG